MLGLLVPGLRMGGGGSATLVYGPICFQAATIYHPGAQAATVIEPGAKEAVIYHPGAQTGKTT